MDKQVKKESKKNSAGVTGSAVEKLVEEISKLSVLDLSELVNTLSDKLGVSAMPAAQAAAPAAAGDGAADAGAEEGGNKTVVLASTGDNKIAVIKALREINQELGLKEAKDATESTPYEVLKDAKPEDVKSAEEKLKTAGATVELK
ncbi:50S ribosomal protein L7/L12 [Candidatus Microgenomates bacterium]|nr:50S ribosomal protein L7/L12 [Candidatus Microgenomates bacterium]